MQDPITYFPLVLPSTALSAVPEEPVLLWLLSFPIKGIATISVNINSQDSVLLKGVQHLRLVFGLFLHFSQKLQHIGNK